VAEVRLWRISAIRPAKLNDHGTKDQFYDIDFWLDTKTGKMTVTNVKVHKVPIFMNGAYVQIPRYNFDSKTFDIVP